MTKEEIILELDRLKSEAVRIIKLEECYTKKMFGCDTCINEINGYCELNSEAECLVKAFDELKELVDAIL